MSEPLDLAPIQAALSERPRPVSVIANGHVYADSLLAEVERLRAELERYQGMSDQSCELGVHPDWLANTDDELACPWCFIAQQRDVIARLRAAAVSAPATRPRHARSTQEG